MKIKPTLNYTLCQYRFKKEMCIIRNMRGIRSMYSILLVWGPPQTDFFDPVDSCIRCVSYHLFFILALDLESLECQVVRFVTHLGVL